MGADSFRLFYGLRKEVADPEEVLALERKSHPLQDLARRAHLKSWWGSIDGDRNFYVLVGTELMALGLENDDAVTLSVAQLEEIVASTEQKFRAVGIDEPRAMHGQFEADF